MYCTNNYLLVKILEPSDQTKGGIVLPDKAKGKPRWGVVLDVGEGLCDLMGNLFKPDFQVGNHVYFFQHGPEKIDYSDLGLPKELYIVSEGDVLLKKESKESEMQPMGNLLLVELLDDSVKKTSAGGIILPDTALDRPTKAKVLSVGPGQRVMGGGYYKPPVEVGDIVRFRPGTDLKVGEEENLRIVGYGDVVFIEKPGFDIQLKTTLELVDAN